MSDFIQVVTTVPTKDEGMSLGRMLVGQRLVACMQIAGPVTSVYRWQGKIEEATEYTVTLKTRASLFAKIVEMVEGLHSYDVPEIIGTPLGDCSGRYLQWLEGELQDV